MTSISTIIKVTYLMQITICLVALAALLLGGIAFVQQQYWLTVANAFIMLTNAAIFGVQSYLRRWLRCHIIDWKPETTS